jgi:hypothetical protein
LLSKVFEKSFENRQKKSLKVFLVLETTNPVTITMLFYNLKIKIRAQQITLKPNIIKVKKILAKRFVVYNTTSSEQSK